jgi:hypothetical protein
MVLVGIFIFTIYTFGREFNYFSHVLLALGDEISDYVRNVNVLYIAVLPIG